MTALLLIVEIALTFLIAQNGSSPEWTSVYCGTKSPWPYCWAGADTIVLTAAQKELAVVQLSKKTPIFEVSVPFTPWYIFPSLKNPDTIWIAAHDQFWVLPQNLWVKARDFAGWALGLLFVPGLRMATGRRVWGDARQKQRHLGQRSVGKLLSDNFQLRAFQDATSNYPQSRAALQVFLLRKGAF